MRTGPCFTSIPVLPLCLSLFFCLVFKRRKSTVTETVFSFQFSVFSLILFVNSLKFLEFRICIRFRIEMGNIFVFIVFFRKPRNRESPNSYRGRRKRNERQRQRQRGSRGRRGETRAVGICRALSCLPSPSSLDQEAERVDAHEI